MYTVNDLVNYTPDEFKRELDKLINRYDGDWIVENYTGREKQRDLSIDFNWGHNHDFGTFKLEGKMGNRHITLVDWALLNIMGMDNDLSDFKIMDIGSWTGGIPLYLSTKGNPTIFAVEEVNKYASIIRFLAYAFGLKDLSVINNSFYFLDDIALFDIIFCCVVIYHLSDPIVALRKMHNNLFIGGTLILETEIAVNLGTTEKVLVYRGPTKQGWNWFFPNSSALNRMLKDVGFSIECFELHGSRARVIAAKNSNTSFMQCGLSQRC
jgi:SAM-dependent methyltransferase